MDGLGRQVDRLDPALRTYDADLLLAQGPGQPVREGGDKVGAP
jgi:hypothetical protein